MTRHFLQAGQLRDDLQELLEHARYLRHLLGLNLVAREEMVSGYVQEGYYTTYEAELEKAAARLEEGARALVDLVTRFPCEPLIYTGDGDTESVIAMLEQLLSDSRRRGAEQTRRAQTG